jgi:hypothetical protein
MSEDDGGKQGSITGIALLSTFQTWLPFVTLVGGALWGLYTYMDHHDAEARLQAAQNAKEAKVRVFEASKPFFEKMLAGFAETARLVGTLVTIDPANPKWAEAAERYLELTHGELRLFSVTAMDDDLAAMDAALERMKTNPGAESLKALRDASRGLLKELNDVLYAVYEAHGFVP